MSASVAPLPETPLHAPEARQAPSGPRPPRSSRAAPAAPARKYRTATQWCEEYVELAPSSGRADAWLDGLRALAVLAVVSLHSYQFANAPHVPVLGTLVDNLLASSTWGVPLFFVLSGFLLSRPWFAAELSGGNRPALGSFFLRRAARIAPAYYLSLVVLVALLVPSHVVSPANVSGAWGAGNLLVHLTLLAHLVPWTSTHFATAGGVYWTLTLEVLFYLSLPVFVRLFRGRWMLRTPLLCLVVVTVWGIATREWFDPFVATVQGWVSAPGAAGVHVPADEAAIRTWLYQQFPSWLFAFSLGIALSRLSVRHRAGLVSGRWLRAPVPAAALLSGLALLVLVSDRSVASLSDGPSFTGYVVCPVLVQASLGLILFGLAFGTDGLRRPLEWLPMRYLGWTSYGIYLFHLLVLRALINFTALADGTGPGQYLLLLVTTLLLTVVVATLCWVFVERPCIVAAQRLVQRRRGRRTAVWGARWRGVALGATALALGALVVGEAATRRGAEQAYVGPLGPIRNVAMPAAHTGPLTVSEAMARGYASAVEGQALEHCGAAEGISEGLADVRWDGFATVFTCSDESAAAQTMSAMPAVESAQGFTRVDVGGRSIMLHELRASDPAGGPGRGYALHARFRSGDRLITVKLRCDSPAAGRKALRRVIEPAMTRFPPSFGTG